MSQLPIEETKTEIKADEIVLKKIKPLTFNSNLAIVGAVVGLGYSIFSSKSKILFTIIGAISGAIISKIIKKDK